MKDLISNCFLCEERALHVAGTEEAQVMQCINCGYTTSTKFTGTKETNEEFQKLGEDMKNWAIEKNGKIWIPSFAPMVEIPEEERENFPNEQGGFYERKIDTDNAVTYDLFLEGMTTINKLLKEKHQGKK